MRLFLSPPLNRRGILAFDLDGMDIGRERKRSIPVAANAAALISRRTQTHHREAARKPIFCESSSLHSPRSVSTQKLLDFSFFDERKIP